MYDLVIGKALRTDMDITTNTIQKNEDEFDEEPNQLKQDNVAFTPKLQGKKIGAKLGPKWLRLGPKLLKLMAKVLGQAFKSI